MIGGSRVLAIVPARGGSKGIPRKNIKPLCGRPLLLYTLDVAAGVREIDQLVVSTEDEEISRITNEAGYQVVERPAELAGDTASTESALLQVIETLESDGSHFEYVVVLEPTSPFRSANTIRGALQHIDDAQGESLLAVKETKEVIGRIENGVFRPAFGKEPRRRQDREAKYQEASTIYVARVDYLRRNGTLVSDKWLAYVVHFPETVDINEPLDFLIAEQLMSQKGTNL